MLVCFLLPISLPPTSHHLPHLPTMSNSITLVSSKAQFDKLVKETPYVVVDCKCHRIDRSMQPRDYQATVLTRTRR
ncbi:hypothetical protein EV126DRAFT_421942 [Verticillium dahliae]|nr:hypothetical protein EV126DRAFT_421942 [Verticillium dahliae]